jgi:hypothetical protein
MRSCGRRFRNLCHERTESPIQNSPYRLARPPACVVVFLLLLSLLIADAGCFLRSDPSPFYGRIVVPRSQEFRWSDGACPRFLILRLRPPRRILMPSRAVRGIDGL